MFTLLYARSEVYQPRWKQHPFFAHVGLCDEIGAARLFYILCLHAQKHINCIHLFIRL